MYRLTSKALVAVLALGSVPAALAVLANPGFVPEAAFTEQSPPPGWSLRDQEARALISQANFAYSGSNVFRYEVLARGFGDNKLEQCVPRPSGTDFDFGVQVRTPMPSEELALRLNIEFYRNLDDCLDRDERLSIGNDDFDFPLDLPANVWTEFRSGVYDSSDLGSGVNAQWARISMRVRDRSDDDNPADPPRIVYLDHVTGPDGELVDNGNFAEVSFPDVLEFDQDSGPIGWTMRDLENGAVIETRDFARSNQRLFRFNQLTDAFGDNKLEQCVALPTGTESAQFRTWVRTPQPSEELGVRLNMDFYPGLEDCLFRENRIQRTDSDVFLSPEQFDPDTWAQIQTTSVNIGELPANASWVRIRVSARDTSGANTPLFFDDISTNLANPLVSGAWFDPVFEGEGLNLQQAPSGLFGYWYGYDDGQPLWLQIGLYDGPIVFGQDFDAPVYPPAGGVFGDPIDELPPIWGRLVIRFDSCTTAQATLIGDSGSQSYDLIILGPIDGVDLENCRSVTETENPAGLSAAWFEPATSGQGWNFVYTPAGLLMYFYGYDADGVPLWLVNDIKPVSLGETVSFDLLRGRGGDFGAPVSSTELEVWGSVEMTFDSCEQINAVISGEDGSQEQSLVVLAPTVGVPGCN